jgi:multiple sugar transport system substrate-binding protein
MPAGAGGTASVVGGEDIAISKFSKNKAADQAFLEFMLSKKAQTLMGGIGQMPVLKSLAGNKGLPTYFKIFQKQLLTAKPRTPSPQWNNIDSTISTAVQQALRKQGTVKSDLTAAAKTIDNYLK